jgi:menaquinone-dependent protoporphyrinogen oxidase
MMPQHILVTYATCTGSTVGVAEAVGRALTEYGATVEVRSMKQVADISGYDAVVAGSAIQGKAWLPEAMHWVDDHRAELRQRPFAAFLVCLTLAMKNAGQVEKARPMVAEWLAPVRALVPTRSEGCFSGALDLAKIPSWKDRMGFQISVWMGVWDEGDHRDWTAIHAWGAALDEKLAH